MIKKIICIITAILLTAGSVGASALGTGASDGTPKSGHLVILTGSDLPAGTVGYYYSRRIEANYSDATFSSPDMAVLSSIGITLNNNRLTGTLIKAGTFRFTIAATSEEAGETVEKEFTLVVNSGSDPTAAPTDAPTEAPTTAPTDAPTDAPTEAPTTAPTNWPTTAPTSWPTVSPTTAPTDSPNRLVITTGSELPSRPVGYDYTYRIQANYDDAVFSLAEGSSLYGTGLSLSNNRLKGKLKYAGTYKFTLIATSAKAGESVSKEFTLIIVPAGSTPAPTTAPTETPSVTETPAPTETPDPSGLLTPGVFWGRAADTALYVRINAPFEIMLVEGLVPRITYNGVTGELPNGVQIVTGDGEVRYVAVKGVLTSEGKIDFSIDFSVEGEGRLSLCFSLMGRRGEQAPIELYPDGRPLIPFGGAREAIIPSPARRKEDDAV